MVVKKRGRISASGSPLGRPDAPIYKLAAKVQEKLFYPNPDSLYAVMGALVGNLLPGVPVWLVLVGPPSSGKTLILDMISVDEDHRLPKLFSADAIKSTSALLSGVGQKDIKKGATGGLLRQIGKHGFLIIKDFTSTMSMGHDPLIELVGALRRIYDGAWDRPVGSDGGRVLSWSGKVGLLSACTGVIDGHHQTLGELGERWVYYRMDKSDGYGETRSALNNTQPKETMYELNDQVAEFLEECGVDMCHPEGLERRELNDVESNRVFTLAAFTAAARSSVVRDWRSKEIVTVTQTEVPTRLAAALNQMYLGMEMCGLNEDDRWRVAGRVAIDSVPKLRSSLIKLAVKGAIKIIDAKEALGCGGNAIRWACEDLQVHGVFEQVEKGDRFGDRAGTWRLSEWSRRMLRVGWGIEVNTKRVRGE